MSKESQNYRYDEKNIQQLNKSIKKNFQKKVHIIKPHYFRSFNGVARLVMLDRYSQKDGNLITIQPNDIVLITLNTSSRFPTKIVARVKKRVGKDKMLVVIEKEYQKTIEQFSSKSEANGLKKGNKENEFITKNSNLTKPLEIFFEQIAKRVSLAASRNEKKKDQKENFEKFFSVTSNLKFIPGGRILYGAGNNESVTLYNCYVLPAIPDNKKGIAKHRWEVMEIMARGGGVGSNGSCLRPKGEKAISVNGISSGAISWLNDLASLTHLIEQGGSRRGAQMIMLSDWHPDIIQFIISKIQRPEILLMLKKEIPHPLIIEEVEQKLVKKIENQCYSRVKNLFSSKPKNRIHEEKKWEADLLDSLKDQKDWKLANEEYLSGANISVTISDDFMQQVKKNGDWNLEFPDLQSYSRKEKKIYDNEWHKEADIRRWKKRGFASKIYHTIPARLLWKLIIFSATYSAEPGIFFIDRANKLANANSYHKKIIATNPCGEQPLTPYGVCNLGAINLSKFISKKTGQISWKKLKETVKIAVRLLDNIIDITPYFIKKNEIQQKGERRIGLGIMGLHDLLIWKGFPYGSNKSIKLIKLLFKTIANTSYEASAEIAKEKGNFLFMSNEEIKKRFLNSEFVKRLDPKVRKKISRFGIRNSHLLTVAPTGTTGTLANVSTGLEPYFAFNFKRSGRLGENLSIQAHITSEWLKIKKKKKLEYPLFSASLDLTPKEHADVQCAAQYWIDSSVSKTVNAPEGYPLSKVMKLYTQLFECGAKGGTVYVDKSRLTQVLSENKDREILNGEKKEKIDALRPFRWDRQGREISQKDEAICPMCREGVLKKSAGCLTCNNCNCQLACEL